MIKKLKNNSIKKSEHRLTFFLFIVFLACRKPNQDTIDNKNILSLLIYFSRRIRPTYNIYAMIVLLVV